MKKTTLTLLGLCLTMLTFGQANNNEKLIELAKTYKDFMFSNTATKDVLKDLQSNVSKELKSSTDFIIETITTKNKILTEQFLTRPDDQTLKQIYIIRAINHNLRKEDQMDNHKLIDSLTAADISTYELVDSYYGMIFSSVANKNQPFNLSKVDLKIKDYKLKDDTEKGIVVLRALDFCGTTIWGYMNIVNPPNTKKAFEHIEKFPKINGRPYYQYTDFYFADFEMKIINDQDIQSYKSYYINKFYEALLSHLICLNAENRSDKEKNNLLLGSILKEENLYKYTKHRETLERIFQTQKRD